GAALRRSCSRRASSAREGGCADDTAAPRRTAAIAPGTTGPAKGVVMEVRTSAGTKTILAEGLLRTGRTVRPSARIFPRQYADGAGRHSRHSELHRPVRARHTIG